jgi:hypothetical protein
VQLFGHAFHKDDQPWYNAPAWAIELREMGLIIIGNQETQMAAIDDLNTAVAALQTEVGTIGTDMDAQLAALTAALPPSNDPAILAATTSIQASINALKAAATRDMPVDPAPV